ncbi:MAG: polyribonucleotide nucleotidyltransferase [Candidatus Moraniibacteriota bacterium]|nr:MAG: polyribonucleotide nucleotidyltransferase [Candidatus Moranbacteria bacterium]
MSEKKKWSLEVAGRELVIETGQLAKQAGGAVTVRYGDTQVLATAVMSKDKSGVMGYFPLMVDYEERFYAAGKIKGSRFIKREGRPSDEAVLTGRAVDRTIRPLFDMRMRNEVQVVITVQSIDGENDPDIISIIAASAALSISDIPWDGPVAAVKVGMVDGQVILNPTEAQEEKSTMNLTLAGTTERVNMIEAGAHETPEDDVVRAFDAGHAEIKKIAAFIKDIKAEVGKEKRVATLLVGTPDMEQMMRETLIAEGIEDALFGTKEEIGTQTAAVKEKAEEVLREKLSEEEQENFSDIFALVYDEVCDTFVHKNIIEQDKRPDGRATTEIRPIACDTGVLPRPHGSGLFTRGETQALTVTTLGAPGDEQVIDTMEVDEKKRYIHHYNFPPYSVGEVRFMRGPGRREIGHGALAEKALVPVIPSKEDFPYTILLVSEILESNGSSSMAATCGSTLSLMHAGVPIVRPVSGIAMGMMTNFDTGDYKVLSDIQGAEDHYGDMDLKVAGTEKGITALQMDVKMKGINTEMFRATLAQAREGRMHILGEMLKVIAEPNQEMSPYAPRIITMQIDPDKIRDVIGPGGKMINEIIEKTGVSIDIEDDGSVFITATEANGGEEAQNIIHNLTKEVETGEVYEGTVVRIMDFGAFVEILPGKDGLVHISELAHKRVEKVTDVVKIGDKVNVKVKEIDSQGRINLSMKVLMEKPQV